MLAYVNGGGKCNTLVTRKLGDLSAQTSTWLRVPLLLTAHSLGCRFGNRYFENLNPEEEVPGMFVVDDCPLSFFMRRPRPSPLGRLFPGNPLSSINANV